MQFGPDGAPFPSKTSIHAFDAGGVAPEAVDGRGVDLAVQARQLVDERVVPVVRPIIRLARRAVELRPWTKTGFTDYLPHYV